MVDEGKIALRPAVELSYLNDIEQLDLVEAMDLAMATPSHAQAIKMRNFSREGKLTPEVIESIMYEEKPNQKEKINIRYEDARRYIPSSVPYDKTGEFILKALEYYQKAAERGNITAMYNLVNIYRRGIDTERNIEQATEWYLQAQHQQYSEVSETYESIMEYFRGLDDSTVIWPT